MRSSRLSHYLATLLLVLFLGACGNESAPDPAQEASSRGLTPDDSELASTYNRSCRNCHTVAATGAPLTGDSSAWASLLQEKGMEVLVDNVVNGFKGMPPFGLCMDCNVDDFEALIKFMAGSD